MPSLSTNQQTTTHLGTPRAVCPRRGAAWTPLARNTCIYALPPGLPACLGARLIHLCLPARPAPQSIIRASLEGEYSGLIRTRPVGQWRETLAMLATYTDRCGGQTGVGC